MSGIIAIIFILAIIFYEFTGKICQWILEPIISNPVGAIIVMLLIVIAFARLIKLFMSEAGVYRINFPHHKRTTNKKQ